MRDAPNDGSRRPTLDETADVAVEFPDLTPRGTRQQWTRSALASFDGVFARSIETRGDRAGRSDRDVPAFVVGTGRGVVRAFDSTGTALWRVDVGGMAVALEPTLADGEPVVLVGTRGETAVVTLLDAVTGDPRWTHDVETDLGSATRETFFYYPMTVALASDPGRSSGDRLYAAARRYERDGDDRRFESRVYAFEPDGTVAWVHESDASPVAIDRRDDRLAVAYNRCGGSHQCGLVVLDAASGELRLTWDPGTEGERRVGDVALDADGAVVASHGDYRGYALDEAGRERWRVDLGRPVERGGDTVYTYPNHVALADGRVLFLTGNTFPVEGRDTDGRHPDEHTLAAVDPATGDREATAPIDGWLGGLSAGAGGDDRVALAVGQRFRDRDPTAHGLRLVDPTTGAVDRHRTDGVAVDVASFGDRVAVLEEPIGYHDEPVDRGTHRLLIRSSTATR